MNRAGLEQLSQEKKPKTHLWENIDKEPPLILEGTNFKIPYEAISVRQLITRAEFAREVGQDTATQSYIGRKISIKYFQHPLSHEEHLIIKNNRGNSLQLLFSYLPEVGSEKPKINLDNLPTSEDITLSQKSKYNELMNDKRMVRLSRIVRGTNRKGSEDQSFYYLDNSQEKLRTKYVLWEQAWKNPKPFDFVSSGFLIERSGENSHVVLFCKAQSSKLSNDTLFFAVEYLNGRPVNTVVRNISLQGLPVFEEVLREKPEIIFRATDASELSDFSSNLAIREITMNFPKSFDFKDIESLSLQNSIQLVKVELPKVDYGDNAKLEIHIDPEVDFDIDVVLKNLKKNLGKHLLEVYFYGSIPRGYKGLQSDIDLLAVVSNKESATKSLGGFEGKPQLIHDALGTHTAKSIKYPYRNIEVHTIQESKFKKPDNLRLSEFLRNAFDGAIKIY